MSIRKLLIGLAILIMMACVAILIIPGLSDEFSEVWRPITAPVLFILGFILFMNLWTRASNKKAERVRAKMAEEKAVEEEKKTAEEARIQALPKLINCPVCNKEISREAVACPSCGHPINPIVQTPPTPGAPQRSWSPGVAALLSLIIPGAGQMYKGHVGAGLLWMMFVVAGYLLFIIPGAILHLVCIFNAASGER